MFLLKFYLRRLNYFNMSNFNHENNTGIIQIVKINTSEGTIHFFDDKTNI